jgi:hypothetical protein
MTSTPKGQRFGRGSIVAAGLACLLFGLGLAYLSRPRPLLGDARDGVCEITLRLAEIYFKRVRNYPGHATFEHLLRYDQFQYFNTMRYSQMLNRNLWLMNPIEHDLYLPHAMDMMSFATIDLMCTPRFPIEELGRLREALWHLQCMGRVGNLLSTWRREIGQRSDARADFRGDPHGRRKGPAVDHPVSDGSQGGALGQDGRLPVPQIEDKALDRIGMSLPGNVLGTFPAVRTGVVVSGGRPSPVGLAARDDGAVGGPHEGRFQAAGAGVKQQDVHLAPSHHVSEAPRWLGRNNITTERGSTRKQVPETGGAVSHGTMSSGESSDVSIHLRQVPRSTFGSSNSSGSQYAFSMQ